MEVISNIYNDDDSLLDDDNIINLSKLLETNIESASIKNKEMNILDSHIRDICLCKNMIIQSLLDLVDVHVINNVNEMDDDLYSYSFEVEDKTVEDKNITLLDYLLTFNTYFDFGLDYDGYSVNNAVAAMSNVYTIDGNIFAPADNRKSHGRCAMLVRLFLEAGGINTIGHPVSAYKYWKQGFLASKGFRLIDVIYGKAQQRSWTTSNALPGDIAVMEHGTHGHICMYNGKNWVSDFCQNNAWPYSGEGTVAFFRFSRHKPQNKPEVI